jgi:hypothetical protein
MEFIEQINAQWLSGEHVKQLVNCTDVSRYNKTCLTLLDCVSFPAHYFLEKLRNFHFYNFLGLYSACTTSPSRVLIQLTFFRLAK